MIPPEIAVFGEMPWENYTVMQIVDSTYGGASGLEHQSSHVDVLAPSYVGSEFQPSLYAHEIFHSWNVKRLRPAGDVAISILSSAADAVALGVARGSPTTTPISPRCAAASSTSRASTR